MAQGSSKGRQRWPVDLLVAGGRQGLGVSRRDMLVTGLAGAVALPVGVATDAFSQTTGGGAHPAPESGTWEAALKRIIGDAKPVVGRVQLDLPDVAENGNVVPFTVTVDSPMTAADHIKAVHLLATGNPLPGIASFKFSAASGRAMASSRMRLARSQDVVAVAEAADGTFFLARRSVKVTIGGCGG